MKAILKTIIMMFCVGGVFAQAPATFNYQAVARDGSGAILANQNLGFQMSILESSSSGTAVYVETHNVTSNQFGVVNFKIGAGTVTSGNISSIAWSDNPHFLAVAIDENGGSSYTDMGASELVSVPYALSANGAWNVLNNNFHTYNKVSIGTDFVFSSPDETKLFVFSSGTTTASTFSSAMRADIAGTDGSNVAVVGSSRGTSASFNSGMQGVAENGDVNNGVTGFAIGGATATGGRFEASGNATESANGVGGFTYGNAARNYAVAGNDFSTGGDFSAGIAGFSNGAATRSYGVIGYNANSATTDYNTGTYGYAEGAPVNYGVDGTSNDDTGESYGNTGWALGEGTHNYAMFALAGADADTNYAGFFEGDVHVTGTLTQPSDRRLKENIQPMSASLLRSGGVLRLLEQLNPVSYVYKTDMVEKINLPSFPQYGFIAQEVELLFPDLIKQESTPEFKISTVDDGKGHKMVKKEKVATHTYKAINYVGLIPVLTQALKEQQLEIEALKRTNLELKNSMETKIKALEKAVFSN
jgi:hypothetical protein